MWAASQSPWAAGTSVSARPNQTDVGIRDRTDLEAPRRDEGEIVVQPTIDTFPQAVGDDLFEDGAVLRLLVAIRVRELVLLGEGVRLARRDPLEDLEALGLDQGTQSSLTLE